MKVNLRHLSQADVLDRFLSPVPQAERTAFQKCYAERGGSAEVREWWDDICVRIVPNFPEPEPSTADVVDILKGMRNYEKDAATGGKRYLWNRLINIKYGTDGKMESASIRDVERSRIIMEDVWVQYKDLPNECKLLIYKARNLKENNYRLTPAFKLTVLGLVNITVNNEYIPPQSVLDYLKEKDIDTITDMYTIIRTKDDAIVGVTKADFRAEESTKFMEVVAAYARSKKEQPAEKDIIKFTASDPEVKEMFIAWLGRQGISEERAKGEAWWNMTDLHNFMKCKDEFGPVSDYLVIRAITDRAGLRAVNDAEYKKYNPRD
jgi:hypothetical protein